MYSGVRVPLIPNDGEVASIESVCIHDLIKHKWNIVMRGGDDLLVISS